MSEIEHKDYKCIRKVDKSYNVEVHMAGDIREAGLFLQQVAARRGMCVSITPTSFIYSGGREEGFRIGFINYPRFPQNPEEILRQAEELADWVRDHIGQYSWSITTPDETIYYSEIPKTIAQRRDGETE